MEKNSFLEINKNGWNTLVKENNSFSNASLPEYGPFMVNEEELKIFKDVKNKKVLELGCASGNSLKYLESKGAGELWGVDISSEQIEKALNANIKNSNFFVSSMEVNPGIPNDYFDYVMSLYSIGYSSNPLSVFKLASSYLKKNGKFVLCWAHPFFNCLSIQDDKLTINHNYNDETPQIITKGENKVELMQYNLKISTLINGIIDSGMEIENVFEENPTEENRLGSYVSPYFDKRKLNVAPTTLIIVAHKK